MKRSFVAAVIGALWMTGWSVSAEAQTSLAAQETTVPGGVLVLVTYIILWVLFGGFLFSVGVRQRKLRREIEGLDARIDEVLGGGNQGAG